MPTIAAAVSALPVKSVILDGELVAVDAKGKAAFYELPMAVSAKNSRVKARLAYYAFDLLYLDGIDLRGAPLLDRKGVLARSSITRVACWQDRVSLSRRNHRFSPFFVDTC